MFFEEPLPIAVHDVGDVFLAVTAFLEDGCQLLIVGYRVDFEGGTIDAVLTVSVSTDGRMQGIAGQLADVIDVIGYVGEGDGLTRKVVAPRKCLRVRPVDDLLFTPPRSMMTLSCSSENWRWPGARARQFWWVANRGPL